MKYTNILKVLLGTEEPTNNLLNVAIHDSGFTTLNILTYDGELLAKYNGYEFVIVTETWYNAQQVYYAKQLTKHFAPVCVNDIVIGDEATITGEV